MANQVITVLPTRATALLNHITQLLIKDARTREDTIVAIPSLRERARLTVSGTNYFIVQDEY